MKVLIKNMRVIVILLFSLLITSCEGWLNVSPKSEVKYDDLFSYKNGFKDQLTGVYTALCSDNLYGANLTFGMADALGSNMYGHRRLVYIIICIDLNMMTQRVKIL